MAQVRSYVRHSVKGRRHTVKGHSRRNPVRTATATPEADGFILQVAGAGVLCLFLIGYKIADLFA